MAQNNHSLCSHILRISTLDRYSTVAHLRCLVQRLRPGDLQAGPGIIYCGRCPSMWDTLGFFKAWWLGSKVLIPQEKVRERRSSRARQKLCYYLSPGLRSHAVSLLLHSVGAVTNSHPDSRAHHSVEGVPKSHREKSMWNERYWCNSLEQYNVPRVVKAILGTKEGSSKDFRTSYEATVQYS